MEEREEEVRVSYWISLYLFKENQDQMLFFPEKTEPVRVTRVKLLTKCDKQEQQHSAYCTVRPCSPG